MLETHKLNETGFKAVGELKANIAELANYINFNLPNGREKSIVITKLEEASFFATKAIASKEGNFSEVIYYGEKGELKA